MKKTAYLIRTEYPDHSKVIKAVLATDASADDKIKLIEQILEL